VTGIPQYLEQALHANASDTFIECCNLVAIKYNANIIRVSIFWQRCLYRIQFMKMSKLTFPDSMAHQFPKVLSMEQIQNVTGTIVISLKTENHITKSYKWEYHKMQDPSSSHVIQ
jgi:hypothetical protein